MKNWIKWPTLLLLCLAVAGTQSCKDDDDDMVSEDDDNTSTGTEFFVKMLIDNDSVILEPTPGGANPIGFIQVDASTPTDSCIHNYAGGMGFPVLVDPNTQELKLTGESVLFELVHFFKDSCDKENERFHSLFPVGSVNFSTTSTEKGVVIYWVDEDDKIWRSNQGPQAGSSFTITVSDSVNSTTPGKLRHQIKGTFNCPLYLENTNAILVSASGEFAITVDDR